MNHEEKLRLELAKEITDLWYECKTRCDKIEEIAKKINKTKGIDFQNDNILLSE